MEQSCETCEHAVWQRTKNGRRKLNKEGVCKFLNINFIPDPLARIININNISFTISRELGENCKCYSELWKED